MSMNDRGGGPGWMGDVVCQILKKLMSHVSVAKKFQCPLLI